MPYRDFGQCFMALGYVFDDRNFRCFNVPGCDCDESCQQNEIPFRQLADCEAACLGAPRDQLP
ncbi:MAG: hypothetical protein HY906_04755 [Deltaproteobacteria bacterium]|nr:hypothetical protein [Deltaproteobacteria bacterium]